MLLVTGGAGFIGSNVVADLNEAGRTDVVVNDTLDHALEKVRTILAAERMKRGRQTGIPAFVGKLMD